MRLFICNFYYRLLRQATKCFSETMLCRQNVINENSDLHWLCGVVPEGLKGNFMLREKRSKSCSVIVKIYAKERLHCQGLTGIK